MKTIGAQYYTIRDHLKTEKDVEESFFKIADIGYSVCQCSGIMDIDPKLLREISDKSGVKITATHTRWDRFENNLDKVIDAHKAIGSHIAGLGAMGDEYRGSVDGIKAFMAKANDISDRLADAGLQFTYHNHAFEFMRVDGKFVFDYIFDMANDNFKLMLDVYWLSFAGINPAKFITAHADKIGGVHFKDLAVDNYTVKMAEVMEGTLDWDEIIAACDKAGVKDIYVEQDDCYGKDPFEALRTSYENLKTKGYK